MNEFSVAARALLDYAAAHRDDAAAIAAIREHLPTLKVSVPDWGELPFASALDSRWSAALDARLTGLNRLRERMSDVPQWLRRAADEFAELDGASARDLRRAAGESVAGTDVDTTERETDAGAAHAGLSRLLVAPADRESPGSEELMSCRADHLSTLEHAEELLRQCDRLDFTAPTEYLRQLATVRPQAVGGRAEPLAALSSYLDQTHRRFGDDAALLSRDWSGETATAFDGHTADTAVQLEGTVAELAWLSREAEAVWLLLDTLLHNVADAVWGRVDAVGESRIARIDAAVSLVEDVNGYAAGPSGDRAVWGGLSGGEVDAAVQVLYKRVWYLANAMDVLVTAAGDAAAERLDPTSRPETA